MWDDPVHCRQRHSLNLSPGLYIKIERYLSNKHMCAHFSVLLAVDVIWPAVLCSCHLEFLAMMDCNLELWANIKSHICSPSSKINWGWLWDLQSFALTCHVQPLKGKQKKVSRNPLLCVRVFWSQPTEMKLGHRPSHPVAVVTPKSAYCEGQRLFVPNISQFPQSPVAVWLHAFATNRHVRGWPQLEWPKFWWGSSW